MTHLPVGERVYLGFDPGRVASLATNVSPEERDRLLRLVHEKEDAKVSLVAVFRRDSYHTVASVLLEPTSTHHYLCMYPPGISVYNDPAKCGCEPSCPMPRPRDFVADACCQTDCRAAIVAREVFSQVPPRDLYDALYGRVAHRRILALCEMLVEDAVVRAVAVHLPLVGLPELVTKYALCVLRRTGTWYE